MRFIYSIYVFIFLMVNAGILLMAGEEGPFLHVFVDRSVGLKDVIGQKYIGSWRTDVTCQALLTQSEQAFKANGIEVKESSSFYICMLAEKNNHNIRSFDHLTSYETAKQLTPYPFPADFLQGNDGNFKESVQLDNQKFTIVPCHFLDSCTSIASLGSAMKKLCASIPSLGGSKVDELIQNKDVTADKKKDTFTQNEDTPVSKASKPALNTNKWINWQAIITNKVLLFSLIMAALFGGLKASNLV